VDGYDRVSGTAVYPSDVILPGMLHAAVLRCPHPHARIRTIDARAAEKLPGVRAVLTGVSPDAKDVPWPYGGGARDALFPDVCRFEGEVVAAVAADDPYVARDALRKIEVSYEVLPFVSEMGKALAPGAPAIHRGGNRVGDPSVYERGSTTEGFAAANVVVERTFSTACELHTPMELHGCVASWDGRRLTIWESTQGVFGIQARVAQLLRLPLSRVRVIGHYVGGGFGSKLQAGKYTVIASLLAKRTARPVKLFLDREDTFLAAGNRPPSEQRLKAGVKKDGTLTALELEGLGTGGAWPAGGTSLLDWLVRDLYLCPNVRTVTTDVYTNAGPARPFRAPGHPQGAWALEQVMDELAERIGMDPVELRLRNVPEVSQARGNRPFTTTGLARCLTEGAKAFDWAGRRERAAAGSEGHMKRGVGVAACLWIAGGGGPPSTVVIKLFRDGSVNLNLGASDIGTGTKTVMALVAAEELGVDPAEIQIEHADTGTTQFATPSGGSKTVPTESPAVRAAAIEVKRQLLAMAAEELSTEVGDLVIDGASIVSRKEPGKSVRITRLREFQRRGVVVGVGYRGPNPAGKVVCPFAAQFCEVEVNTLTGEVTVLDFLGAHDSGRVMDRKTYDNQVFGGITMGIGLAQTEFRVLDDGQTGKLVNKSWHDYKLPTSLDVPPGMTSLPIDLGDEEANSTGAKGIGEPVTIPTAAAIANAVHHATGVRPTSTPVNAFHTPGLLGRGKGR
jgi:xanthine dehydrogenase YagR molybdenum-binding subunit